MDLLEPAGLLRESKRITNVWFLRGARKLRLKNNLGSASSSLRPRFKNIDVVGLTQISAQEFATLARAPQ